MNARRAAEIRRGIRLARSRPDGLHQQEWARFCESLYMPQSTLGGARPDSIIFEAFHRTLRSIPMDIPVRAPLPNTVEYGVRTMGRIEPARTKGDAEQTVTRIRAQGFEADLVSRTVAPWKMT